MIAQTNACHSGTWRGTYPHPVTPKVEYVIAILGQLALAYDVTCPAMKHIDHRLNARGLRKLVVETPINIQSRCDTMCPWSDAGLPLRITPEIVLHEVPVPPK